MGQPRIFVFCPDLPKPLGGVRMLYRHVDILNANGFEAAIVHSRPGFRVKWFEHSTRIVEKAELRPEDIAAYSEIGGVKIATWAKGNRKVIFNQNAYYTFTRYPLAGRVPAAYRHPEVVGTIVVSQDSKRYLEYVFPKHPIYQIQYSIDQNLYHSTGRKQKQICFMPRKNLNDAKQVLNILRFRGVLEGWKVALIDGLSEADAAAVMRDSAIFLSFGYPEGFGLPPAEAMSSGCITVGYHGGGGRCFLRHPYAIPIEVSDIIGYAQAVEGAIERFSSDLDGLRAMAKEAAGFIRETYSPERETESILWCWRQILGTQGRSAT